MVGELFGEAPMRPVVLGDDEKPGRVLVEPVHDAGPLDPADPGQALAAMGDERVDERPRLVPRRRMHHEPCRLVDDDEVVVLVDDGERDRLALRLRGSGRRQVERHARPGCSFRPGSSTGVPSTATCPPG